MKKLTKSYLKRVVVCGNRTPRLQFRKHFTKEIDDFTDAIFKAYKQYALLKGNQYNRESVVKLYAFTSIQNLVSAFNIFISGYPIPAGNLRRHFHESVSWAILFSTKQLDFYDKFKKDKGSISYQKGPEYVQRHISKLNINKNGWQTFMKIDKFYDKFSHSTAFAVALNFIFSENSAIALGSHFDSKKLPLYKKEMTSMLSAANILENIIIGITEQIKKEK